MINYDRKSEKGISGDDYQPTFMDLVRIREFKLILQLVFIISQEKTCDAFTRVRKTWLCVLGDCEKVMVAG